MFSCFETALKNNWSGNIFFSHLTYFKWYLVCSGTTHLLQRNTVMLLKSYYQLLQSTTSIYKNLAFWDFLTYCFVLFQNLIRMTDFNFARHTIHHIYSFFYLHVCPMSVKKIIKPKKSFKIDKHILLNYDIFCEGLSR